jgi:hypothetical protein
VGESTAPLFAPAAAATIPPVAPGIGRQLRSLITFKELALPADSAGNRGATQRKGGAVFFFFSRSPKIFSEIFRRKIFEKTFLAKNARKSYPHIAR